MSAIGPTRRCHLMGSEILIVFSFRPDSLEIPMLYSATPFRAWDRAAALPRKVRSPRGAPPKICSCASRVRVVTATLRKERLCKGTK